MSRRLWRNTLEFHLKQCLKLNISPCQFRYHPVPELLEEAFCCVFLQAWFIIESPDRAGIVQLINKYIICLFFKKPDESFRIAGQNWADYCCLNPCYLSDGPPTSLYKLGICLILHLQLEFMLLSCYKIDIYFQ